MLTPTTLASARADGSRDAVAGLPSYPWPWDDAGELEAAYRAGYATGAETRREVLSRPTDPERRAA